MDRNHDWVNDAQKNYSREDLSNVREFLSQASTNVKEVSRGNDEDNVDIQNLNQKQKTVHQRIVKHYQDIISGNQPEPLRIIVMGTAGTGKSYLIRTIRKQLNMMAGNDTNTPIRVIAPTGVAAYNINGATVHSTLSLPIYNNQSTELDGNRLKQLQERLHDVIYIIIDEKSMVGRRMLSLIDLRLRQATPERKDEPFGGKSVILFGDFGQLPPVCDIPMYADNRTNKSKSQDGIGTYNEDQVKSNSPSEICF